jgi:hypothetical protein
MNAIEDGGTCCLLSVRFLQTNWDTRQTRQPFLDRCCTSVNHETSINSSVEVARETRQMFLFIVTRVVLRVHYLAAIASHYQADA